MESIKNIFKKVMDLIKGISSKQKKLDKAYDIDEEKMQVKVSEKDKQEKISIEELEELQYELEVGYITEDDLTEFQKQQLIELYDNQINELQQNVNYIKYEISKKKN